MMLEDMPGLKDIKEDHAVLKDIIWDLEPKQLMEPTYYLNKEGKKEKKILRGYMFYIDRMSFAKPGLFLMCHTGSSYAETIAKVSEVPDELVNEAIEENKSKEYFGMVPINKKIEVWLKKELGIIK